LSQTDPRNQGVYASYDLLNRPLCRGTSSAAVKPCQSSAYATYFYDSYNNTSNPTLTFPSGCTAPGGSYASDPIGHATAEFFSGNGSVGTGWRCSGFDQRGQTDQSTLSVTADGQTTTQTVNLLYNDGGQVTGLVYPDGETVTSQYDVNGFFHSSYFGAANAPDPVNFLVGQTTYNTWGSLAGMSMGGSGPKASGPTTPIFTTAFGYDSIERPLSRSATRNSVTFWSQALTYDNVGNILGATTTVPTVSSGTLTQSEAFCYDALNRLAWAGNTGTPTGGDHCMTAPTGTTLPTYQQAYSYDSLDRITSGDKGTVSYSDTNHVHATTTLGSLPNPYASYDAMGNMTCRNIDTTSAHTCGSNPTGASMTYDAEGRMDSWTAPSGTTASDKFLYDNEGNRVLQRTSTTTGSTTTVTDDITFNSFTEVTISGGTTATAKFYSAGGRRVAMRVNGTLSYLLSDILGSSTVALNSDGSGQAVQLFSPYGSVNYSWGSMPTTYNFTGQRLDSQTGLLYYNSRYYDPVSERFVRADTVQNNANGMDPYAYVGGNPETMNDPTGQCIHDPENPYCGGGGGGNNSSSPTGPTSGSPSCGQICTFQNQAQGFRMWALASAAIWDGYVLGNKYRFFGDLVSALTLWAAPVVDGKVAVDILARGTLRAVNQGSVFETWKQRLGEDTLVGIGDAFSTLFAIGTGAYYIFDWVNNPQDGWQDAAYIASAAIYLLKPFLKRLGLSDKEVDGLSFALAFTGAIIQTMTTAADSSSDGSNDDRKKRSSGGGGPPFPPAATLPLAMLPYMANPDQRPNQFGSLLTTTGSPWEVPNVFI
jgi:RHS repeat-associated protein